MSYTFVLQQMICGAIAATGFGVLFNVRFRLLAWCGASGAIALAVRTCCLEAGLNLEGASFTAALTIGAAAALMRARTKMSEGALAVVGCIPMVPGSFAAKAIIGLYALTISNEVSDPETLIAAVRYTLRVMFTIGAIGTGLAIPTVLLRVRPPKNS
jgi:uncharacterized membrane protein YjjB (DUF3815 family)